MDRTAEVFSTTLFSLLLAAMLIVQGVAAEAPSVEWQKTYGGVGFDMAWSLIQTADGGYAFAGESQVNASGVNYAWLVTTDAFGNEQWNKTYGGTFRCTFRSVIQTVDGGYAIAGMFANDFWLVKTDASGNEQWSRTYDPKSSEIQDMSGSQDYAWGLVQTVDGGYALTGMTQAPTGGGSDDVWLVKTDTNGNALWNKTYGGADVDYAYDVVQTVDGGYAIGGGTEILGRQIDFWLIKTDSNGDALWNKTFGRADTDWLYSMIQTTDGGYALAGGYAYDVAEYAGWLVKTDANGNEQWNKTDGTTFTSLVQTVDGGYALAGGIDSSGAGVFKTDADGNVQWNKAIGGAIQDQVWSVVQASDGDFTLLGWTEAYGAGNRDVWLIKTTKDVIPEFTSNLIPTALMIAITLTTVLAKKKRVTG